MSSPKTFTGSLSVVTVGEKHEARVRPSLKNFTAEVWKLVENRQGHECSHISWPGEVCSCRRGCECGVKSEDAFRLGRCPSQLAYITGRTASAVLTIGLHILRPVEETAYPRVHRSAPSLGIGVSRLKRADFPCIGGRVC